MDVRRPPQGVQASDDDSEGPVDFDKIHYASGLNGDFLSDLDAAALIEKYAGEKGGGGMFEDPERRDIASAVPGKVFLLLCIGLESTKATFLR